RRRQTVARSKLDVLTERHDVVARACKPPELPSESPLREDVATRTLAARRERVVPKHHRAAPQTTPELVAGCSSDTAPICVAQRERGPGPDARVRPDQHSCASEDGRRYPKREEQSLDHLTRARPRQLAVAAERHLLDHPWVPS